MTEHCATFSVAFCERLKKYQVCREGGGEGDKNFFVSRHTLYNTVYLSSS